MQSKDHLKIRLIRLTEKFDSPLEKNDVRRVALRKLVISSIYIERVYTECRFDGEGWIVIYLIISWLVSLLGPIRTIAVGRILKKRINGAKLNRRPKYPQYIPCYYQ